MFNLLFCGNLCCSNNQISSIAERLSVYGEIIEITWLDNGDSVAYKQTGSQIVYWFSCVRTYRKYWMCDIAGEKDRICS